MADPICVSFKSTKERFCLGCSPEAAFILTIAACTVHEERPDPRQATATAEQQRWAWVDPLNVNAPQLFMSLLYSPVPRATTEDEVDCELGQGRLADKTFPRR